MKKFLALVTLVCMVLTATAAFAFPSKTAQDMTTVVTGAPTNGVVADPSFEIYVTEPTVEIEEEVAEIYTHVQDAALVTYFDAETQAKLAEIVADPAALIGYEAVTVSQTNYKNEYGDVTADFTFATAFPEGSEVVVMIQTEGWSVQKAVVENGAIKVLFTEAELAAMEIAPRLVLVLSDAVI